MGIVKTSRWQPPSLPLISAGSSLICLSAGVSSPTSGHRHQMTPEKFVGEQRKSKKRVAIHLQGFVLVSLWVNWGKATIPFWQSKSEPGF